MRRAGTIGFLAALALGLLAVPAQAADPYLLSVGLLGGAGGALDADPPDPGLSQRSLELQLGLVTEPRTMLELRLGRIDFGSGDQLGGVVDPRLEYATVSGEYRFYRNWYDSGIFLGLGGYRLTGDEGAPGGRAHEETVLGLTAGVTGEFEIAQHFALLGQLSGHYVNLDQAQLFANALAGVAVKF
jgi:hypothetical protein